MELYDRDVSDAGGHNAFLAGVGDLMVDRGHETDSNIRNTELLMYTLTETEEPIEPEKVDEVEFNLDSEIEDNPAKADYDVKIVYEDGTQISGRAEELAYSSDLFESMESVEDYLRDRNYSSPAALALDFWGSLFEAGIEANPFPSTSYDSE